MKNKILLFLWSLSLLISWITIAFANWINDQTNKSYFKENVQCNLNLDSWKSYIETNQELLDYFWGLNMKIREIIVFYSPYYDSCMVGFDYWVDTNNRYWITSDEILYYSIWDMFWENRGEKYSCIVSWNDENDEDNNNCRDNRHKKIKTLRK